MPQLPRVLLCAVPGAVAPIDRILGRDVELVTVTNTEEAVVRVREGGWELVLCSVPFDGSRMFDLLRLVSSDPDICDIPFVCFRAVAPELGMSFSESVETACSALGARGFVDLLRLEAECGTARAEGAFRRYVLNEVHRGAGGQAPTGPGAAGAPPVAEPATPGRTSIGRR